MHFTDSAVYTTRCLTLSEGLVHGVATQSLNADWIYAHCCARTWLALKHMVSPPPSFQFRTPFLVGCWRACSGSTLLWYSAPAATTETFNYVHITSIHTKQKNADSGTRWPEDVQQATHLPETIKILCTVGYHHIFSKTGAQKCWHYINIFVGHSCKHVMSWYNALA